MIHLVEFSVYASGWGEVKLARPVRPGEDGWGPLKALRGTSWERALNRVDAKTLSHALHGNPWPLLRELGLNPHDVGKVVPDSESLCARLQDKSCSLRDKAKCKLGSDLPDCYEPPGVAGEDFYVFLEVALCLREERYIVVPHGPSIQFKTLK